MHAIALGPVHGGEEPNQIVTRPRALTWSPAVVDPRALASEDQDASEGEASEEEFEELPPSEEDDEDESESEGLPRLGATQSLKRQYRETLRRREASWKARLERQKKKDSLKLDQAMLDLRWNLGEEGAIKARREGMRAQAMFTAIRERIDTQIRELNQKHAVEKENVRLEMAAKVEEERARGARLLDEAAALHASTLAAAALETRKSAAERTQVLSDAEAAHAHSVAAEREAAQRAQHEAELLRAELARVRGTHAELVRVADEAVAQERELGFQLGRDESSQEWDSLVLAWEQEKHGLRERVTEQAQAHVEAKLRQQRRDLELSFEEETRAMAQEAEALRAEALALRETAATEREARAAAETALAHARAELESAAATVEAAERQRAHAALLSEQAKAAVDATALLEADVLAQTRRYEHQLKRSAELEALVARLTQENATLVGHSNGKQRIHFHHRVQQQLELARKENEMLVAESVDAFHFLRFMLRAPDSQRQALLCAVEEAASGGHAAAVAPPPESFFLHAGMDANSSAIHASWKRILEVAVQISTEVVPSRRAPGEDAGTASPQVLPKSSPPNSRRLGQQSAKDALAIHAHKINSLMTD